MASRLAALKEEVKRLACERDGIEARVSESSARLAATGVGMDKALVDGEVKKKKKSDQHECSSMLDPLTPVSHSLFQGFPLPGLDLHAIREDRHRIIGEKERGEKSEEKKGDSALALALNLDHLFPKSPVQRPQGPDQAHRRRHPGPARGRPGDGRRWCRRRADPDGDVGSAAAAPPTPGRTPTQGRATWCRDDHRHRRACRLCGGRRGLARLARRVRGTEAGRPRVERGR